MTHVKSPITDGDCKIIQNISTRYIENLYKEKFSIDISRNFKNINELLLCKCLDTGYFFYFPHEIAGDPRFYHELYSQKENRSWSYKIDKWEFQQALAIMGDTVSDLLDIGTGAGDFLQLVKDQVKSCTGLETNPFAIAEARRRGLTIFNQTVDAYAAENPAQHDIITAFQVLEHIPDVRNFVSSCIRTLKPGGRLIIAVPDNGGFVGKQDNLPLNLPPHHVGLWNNESLRSLADAFSLRLVRIEYEPLGEENINWYTTVMEDLYLPKSRILRSIFYRCGFHHFFATYVRENRESIHGHTIMAVYQKEISIET